MQISESPFCHATIRCRSAAFCSLPSLEKEQQFQSAAAVAEATTHHGVPAQRGPVGESAAAEAAHVGLLPRVDALVPLQGVELRELLVAVFAAVRTLACSSGMKGTSGHRANVGKRKIKGVVCLCAFNCHQLEK